MRHIKIFPLLTFIVLFPFVILSCNNGNKEKLEHESQEQTTNEIKEADQTLDETSTTEKTVTFDINSIPVSEATLGDFPFFSLPDGLKPINKPIQRKYDALFFPIDSLMIPLEGKIWKTSVTAIDGYDAWSLPFFLKSYDEAITTVGGVKIYEGKVSREELDRIKDEAIYFGEGGSMDYWNEPVKVYLIRRTDGKDIYIQLSGNTAGGEIQILQKEGFVQTITMLKSDQIEKDLNEKGKAILYINFDIDKSSLKSDGKEAIDEIAKALKNNLSLKIAINGYTDNSGNDDHNKKLSNDRAQTVLKMLVAAGIDKSRLTAAGFGAQNSIADNASEEGKAKNRRVELVKL